MFSKVIIDTVTEDRVSANAYDLINTDDLSQDELENLFDTIGLLDDSMNNNHKMVIVLVLYLEKWS